jgi:hypothetical protein
MEMATNAIKLMAMTVCTTSVSQCQSVVFEPSTVRSNVHLDSGHTLDGRPCFPFFSS